MIATFPGFHANPYSTLMELAYPRHGLAAVHVTSVDEIGDVVGGRETGEYVAVLHVNGPDRFVPGAIGDPGERTFYLQARKGSALISVGLEKSQMAALATRLDDLLEAVEAPPETSSDDIGLEEPIVELFRVGAMALAWDPATEAIVIEAQTPTEDGEYVELPDDAEDGPDLLRVRIDARQARRFVRHARPLGDRRLERLARSLRQGRRTPRSRRTPRNRAAAQRPGRTDPVVRALGQGGEHRLHPLRRRAERRRARRG